MSAPPSCPNTANAPTTSGFRIKSELFENEQSNEEDEGQGNSDSNQRPAGSSFGRSFFVVF